MISWSATCIFKICNSSSLAQIISCSWNKIISARLLDCKEPGQYCLITACSLSPVLGIQTFFLCKYWAWLCARCQSRSWPSQSFPKPSFLKSRLVYLQRKKNCFFSKSKSPDQWFDKINLCKKGPACSVYQGNIWRVRAQEVQRFTLAEVATDALALYFFDRTNAGFSHGGNFLAYASLFYWISHRTWTGFGTSTPATI